MFTFRMIAENDGKTLESCYQLRYMVYCVELGFLPANNHIDERETDEYDRRSQHFVCERSGQIVGYARMITCDNNAEVFPIEEHFRLPKLAVKRTLCCEISRLIVMKRYRRSIAEIGLLRELYHAVLRFGIECSFAAMEAKLKRQLNSLGIPFTQIGDQEWYMGGNIIPCLVYTSEVDEFTKEVNPSVYRFLREGVPDLKGSEE